MQTPVGPLRRQELMRDAGDPTRRVREWRVVEVELGTL
jgi:hypothetical protein